MLSYRRKTALQGAL